MSDGGRTEEGETLNAGGSRRRRSRTRQACRCGLCSATRSSSTLNPQPSNFNSQPVTLNLHPSTLNPQPSTLSTFNTQNSTLNTQHSAFNLQEKKKSDAAGVPLRIVFRDPLISSPHDS